MRRWRDRFRGRGRGRSTAGAGPRDPNFPFLDEQAGARVRALVHQAFAEAGVEVTQHGDHVRDASGKSFGLHNVAAACNADDRGERAWPDVVRRHVASVLSATDADSLAGLDRDDMLSRVFLRLLDRAGVPEQALSWFEYARPVTGNLLEVLVLDAPQWVAFLHDDDVERFGEQDLRAAAVENLVRDPLGEHDVVRGAGGATVHVLHGASVHTASKLLVLPYVLERLLGTRDHPDGLLVAVPNRHQLAFHPIVDATAVPSAQAMAGFAVAGYTDGISPVSPHVYWWRPGRLEQLTEAGEQGMEIHARGEFAELITRLIAERRARGEREPES